MPLLALLVLFIALPLAELLVILKVGDWLGALVGSGALGAILTIGLLAADSVLGAMLLRSQGRIVWRRFNEALAAGKIPHREVQDGVAVIFGGAFLITPGFLTDILGIALLLPPSRKIVMRYAARRLADRAAVKVSAAGQRPRPASDVEGEAVEYPADPGTTPGPAQLER